MISESQEAIKSRSKFSKVVENHQLLCKINLNIICNWKKKESSISTMRMRKKTKKCKKESVITLKQGLQSRLRQFFQTRKVKTKKKKLKKRSY